VLLSAALQLEADGLEPDDARAGGAAADLGSKSGRAPDPVAAESPPVGGGKAVGRPDDGGEQLPLATTAAPIAESADREEAAPAPPAEANAPAAAVEGAVTGVVAGVAAGVAAAPPEGGDDGKSDRHDQEDRTEDPAEAAAILGNGAGVAAPDIPAKVGADVQGGDLPMEELPAGELPGAANVDPMVVPPSADPADGLAVQATAGGATGSALGATDGAPGAQEGGTPSELYPQLVLPPGFERYASSTIVTDIGLANENNEAAGGFISTGIPATVMSARGGPKGALVGGFLGGAIGGVFSGVTHRLSTPNVYAFADSEDGDNQGASAVCTLPRDAPPGTVMSCSPYTPRMSIPFRSWEDTARALVSGAGAASTSTPQFTGVAIEGQPADYLAPEGWEGAIVSDPFLPGTAARAAGDCMSAGLPALGNLAKLRGLPIVPSAKEALAVCGGAVAGRFFTAAQQNDRRIYTLPDGRQVECWFARDLDDGEWKTTRDCTDQVEAVPLPSLQTVLTTIGVDAFTTGFITLVSRGVVRFARGAPAVPAAVAPDPAPVAVPPVSTRATAKLAPVVAEVDRMRGLGTMGDYTRTFETPKGDVRFHGMYLTDELPDGGRRLAVVKWDIMAAEGPEAPRDRRISGVQRELNQFLAQLLVDAKAAGYKQIYLTSARAEWGSSVNPGHELRWIADLTEPYPKWRHPRPGDNP
jgi:hypothetical protein